MTLPWPNYTAEEWKKLLAEEAAKRTALKGGAGSGNYGHVGRPGKVGGSGESGSGVSSRDLQTATTGFAPLPPPVSKENRFSVMQAAGLKVVHVADLPTEVFNLKHPSERAHTERDVSAAKGIVQAFDTLRKEGFGAFADEAQRTAKFVFAGYESTSALMSTVTKYDGDPTVRFIFINSDTPDLKDVPTRKDGAYSGKDTRGVHGAAEETEYYRIAALHELGHLYDSIHHEKMSGSLVEAVRWVNEPAEGKPHGYSRKRSMAEMANLIHELSAYAMSSSADGAAEAFSIMLAGHDKLPVELTAWGNMIRKWGANDHF